MGLSSRSNVAVASRRDLSPTAASRGLRRAYLIGLGLLVALAFGGQLLIQRSLDEQAGDARVVNLAGLQRSRSERLAKEMLTVILRDSPETVTADNLRLQTTLLAFKRTQNGLVDGNQALGLAQISDPGILRQYAKTESEFQVFTAALDNTVVIHGDGGDTGSALTATLTAQERFFDEMNELVSQLDEESAAAVSRTRALEIALLVVTLLALAGLGLGVFGPALRRLSRSIRLFEALSENLPGALLLADSEGRVFHSNPEALDLLGSEPSETLVVDVLGDAAIVTDGITLTTLTDLRCSDGNRVPVRVTTAPFEMAASTSARMYLIHDRSDELQAEKRQHQTEKLEAIGVLAAGIAHEINTPTQFVGDNLSFIGESVTGLLEMASEVEAAVSASEDQLANSQTDEVGADERDDVWKTLSNKLIEIDIEFIREELDVSIEQSLDGVSRVAEIVRAMKDFSHPGSDSRAPADINDALSTTTVMCCSEWRHIAELELSLDPNLPPVPVLLGDMKQVFLNLIVNAAHAISEAKSGEPGRIAVRSFVDGDYAVVEVSDDGPGVPDEIRERIFDPFFTTKEVGKGTGQGLAICRRVVEKGHGGTRDIDRAGTDAGSTFRIRLPLVMAERSPSTREPTLTTV